MSNDKSVTKSAPVKVKDKATVTDTSAVLQTVRTKASPVTQEWEGSDDQVGTTGVDGFDKVRCDLPGNKGLKILTVPGGLYKVKNLAGGTAPAPMGGMHSELKTLLDNVYAYNKKVK